MRFILFGLLSLLAATATLVFRPDLLASYHYGPHIIALTHLFVLGFVTSIVMGAVYQLMPVALSVPLYSERLARFQFWCHAAGVPGMVVSFYYWNMKQAGHFGSLFGLGVALFAVNVGKTLSRASKWSPVACGMASATAWLVVTMLAGLFLASAKCWPKIAPANPLAAMHAHAHLGILGCFVTLILAVSWKLVPMFTLSETQSTRRQYWSIHLINLGLPGTAAAILFQSPWKIFFASLLAGAIVLYLWEISAILRARKRRQLDWGIRTFLTAVSLLIPVSALGMALAWPGLPATPIWTQLENVYGMSGLLGVVAWAILGMLYKILPFLVWHHTYTPKIGLWKVPALADMYSRHVQAAGYWTYAAGLLATCVAVAAGSEPAVRAGWLLISASLVLFIFNTVKILSHWFSPQLHALPQTPKPQL